MRNLLVEIFTREMCALENIISLPKQSLMCSRSLGREETADGWVDQPLLQKSLPEVSYPILLRGIRSSTSEQSGRNFSKYCIIAWG
jgi:hypothetical protein